MQPVAVLAVVSQIDNSASLTIGNGFPVVDPHHSQYPIHNPYYEPHFTQSRVVISRTVRCSYHAGSYLWTCHNSFVSSLLSAVHSRNVTLVGYLIKDISG